jgi:hypothetical protein
MSNEKITLNKNAKESNVAYVTVKKYVDLEKIL